MAGNWEAHSLPSIWAMIEQENACTGADRVLSWDGLAHDVRTQHRRLLQAREALAAVWPPERNTSAQNFLGVMDSLAQSMNETLTRSEDTRAGLRGVFDALSEAQAEIRPLVDFRAEASDDFIPRWLDGAEDEYDEKARAAMRKAEAAIGDYSAQIEAPALFLANPERTGGVEIEGGGGAGTQRAVAGGGGPSPILPEGLTAKPIPVPIPHDPPLVPSSSGGAGAGLATSMPGNSLGLAGALPVAPPTAVAPPIGTPPPVGGSAGLPGGVIGASGFFGLTPGTGTSGVGGGFAGGLPGQSGGRPAAAGRQVPVRTAIPSGAVIGGNPAGLRPGGNGVISMPGVNGVGARPGSGGVVPKPQSNGSVQRPSVNGPGVRQGGIANGGQGIMPMSGASRGRQADAEGSLISGSADQTWDVQEGVAPVIEPSRDLGNHHPGPGVIGMNR
ncbi:hypothetical protein [Actinoplanes sp. NPDC051859]|uniref:hypothetical protein n=1 Tax=Actinoplanes sp. NPDC051859 TaxID=3363909 RepID=UPI00379B1AD8